MTDGIMLLNAPYFYSSTVFLNISLARRERVTTKCQRVLTLNLISSIFYTDVLKYILTTWGKITKK